MVAMVNIEDPTPDPAPFVANTQKSYDVFDVSAVTEHPGLVSDWVTTDQTDVPVGLNCTKYPVGVAPVVGAFQVRVMLLVVCPELVRPVT